MNKSLCYTMCQELSEVFDDLYESVSVEIQVEHGKNEIVTCMYRAPGTSIELFNYHIEVMLKKVNMNKNYYLVGDLNINLLKSETHSQSNDFIELMFSYGLAPLINRPTRITCDSATLIDNIFTNCLKSKKVEY